MIPDFMNKFASFCVYKLAGRHVVILNYHQVLARKNFILPDEPDVAEFIRQLDVLEKYFQIVSIDCLFNESLLSRSKPSLVLTFDDGYKNNHSIVFPELEKRGLTATFFVTSNKFRDGLLWNDAILYGLSTTKKDEIDLALLNGKKITINNKEELDFVNKIDSIIQLVKYLPAEQRKLFIHDLFFQLDISSQEMNDISNKIMMSDEEIVELAAGGMTIGAHASNHDVLTTLDDNDAKHEICKVKKSIEEVLGKAINYYAYPNGKPNIDFTEKHEKMVENAGFKAGFSIKWGKQPVPIQHNRFNIPRVSTWRKGDLGFLINVIEPYLKG